MPDRRPSMSSWIRGASASRAGVSRPPSSTIKRGLATGSKVTPAKRRDHRPDWATGALRMATSMPSAPEGRQCGRGRDTGVDFRVRHHEAEQARCQPFGGEARRRTDDQHAITGAAFKQIDRLADLGEGRVQAGIEQLSCRGQCDLAHLSVEQPLPEQVFSSPRKSDG